MEKKGVRLGSLLVIVVIAVWMDVGLSRNDGISGAKIITDNDAGGWMNETVAEFSYQKEDFFDEFSMDSDINRRILQQRTRGITRRTLIANQPACGRGPNRSYRSCLPPANNGRRCTVYQEGDVSRRSCR